MTSFRDFPIHPTPADQRDKWIKRIIDVMRDYRMRRLKEMCDDPSSVERNKADDHPLSCCSEAAAIYDALHPDD